MRSFSYNVLQYRHDRASGEAINVGVLAFEPEEGRAAFVYDSSYRRLSDLYVNFDGPGYREALRKFETALKRIGQHQDRHLLRIVDPGLRSSDDVARRIWPDQGLSLALSPVRFAVGLDVDEEVKHLYHRYVEGLRRREPPAKRRDDQQLWGDILALSERFEGVVSRLHSAQVGPDHLEFDLVGKGPDDKAVIVEPISLDYLDTSKMMERAYNLGGKVVDLQQANDFDSMYVLLGEAHRESSLNSGTSRVKKYLKRFERVQVFEESEADRALRALDQALR